MRQPVAVFAAALFFAVWMPFCQAAFLANAGLETYDLSAFALESDGWLMPDVLQTVRSTGLVGYAFAAARFDQQPRSVRLAAWTGVKLAPDAAGDASASAQGQFILFPDDFDQIGQEVVLYAQLVLRSYGAAMPWNVDDPQLEVVASVQTGTAEPFVLAANAETAQITALIGHPIDLSLHAVAARPGAGGGPYYAAADLQLVLSLDATTPTSLAAIPVVPGDATMDGEVDGADYTLWADHYLQATASGAMAGDFNMDGLVDGADFTIWADHYSVGGQTLSLSLIPEPSAFWLLAAGAVGVLGCRRLGVRQLGAGRQGRFVVHE